MATETEGLFSTGDVRINILQYVRNQNVHIENEIENIRAGRHIDVTLNQFLESSPDYILIYKRILAAKNRLAGNDFAEKQSARNELADLLNMEKMFKRDVLVLAQTFLAIKESSDRIQRAQQLFIQGDIRGAYNQLDVNDLTDDQENLLLQADFLESKLHMLNQQP